MSALFFAKKVSRLLVVKSERDEHGQRVYTVQGQVFFASAERFATFFDFKEVVENVTIDVHKAHFWDLSAVGALDKVVLKFRREGTEVKLLGLNEASATIVENLGIHNKTDVTELDLTH